MTHFSAPLSIDTMISQENYDMLCRTIKEISGLHLTEEKMYLVSTRLEALAKELKYPSINRLIEELRGPYALKIRVDIAEAMATPETFFFRDQKPFQILKDVVLPDLIARNPERKRFKIWSAACSSGQESYSLGILISELENTLLKDINVQILATDFSSKILKRCQEGLYSQFEVQRGLNIQHLMKYFKQENGSWRVKDTLKHKIEFRQHNLLHTSAQFERFDVIFCRNVLFYFDTPTKAKILNEMANILTPGGYLFLGSPETTLGICDRFGNPTGEKGFFQQIAPAQTQAC